MVDKLAVLFRIQDFQQCCGRVPLADRKLVDFVEHKKRIHGTGSPHALNDTAWHGADIRSAMAADFCFIAHTTKGDTHKAPTSHAFGNRAPQRSFANAGRANEAQNWAALLTAFEFAHAQKLKNTLFGRLQAIMLFIQLGTDLSKVKVVFGINTPGQRKQPVEVVSDHGPFGRGGR